MLTRLYVDNYKTFVNLEINLLQRCLLVGDNGSGKSSCFDVLRALRDFVVGDGDLSALFSPRTRTRWDNRTTQTFELSLRGEGGQYDYRLEISHRPERREQRVELERLQFNDGLLFESKAGVAHLYTDEHEKKAQVFVNWRRSGVGEVNELPGVNDRLVWFRRRMARVFCFSIDPVGMQAESHKETDKPRSDLTDFVSWYRLLQAENPLELLPLFKVLGEVIPSFEAMRLTGKGREEKWLQIQLNSDAGQFTVDFDELSDGQRALVALYAVVRFVANADVTLCFDEPDNFVALREIQPWLADVVERTEGQSGRQFVIISHHPEIISYLGEQQALLMRRTSSGPTRIEAVGPDETLGLAERLARGWLDG